MNNHRRLFACFFAWVGGPQAAAAAGRAADEPLEHVQARANSRGFDGCVTLDLKPPGQIARVHRETKASSEGFLRHSEVAHASATKQLEAALAKGDVCVNSS